MKTVTLTKPLSGGKVMSFSFRDPRFDDYMLIGDPRVAVPSGEDDKVFMRPIPERVRQYAERLLDEKSDPAVMAFASLRDTLAIQTVILGFFRDAESVPAEKKTNSSDSDETLSS